MTTLNCFFHLIMTFMLYSSLSLVLFSYIPVKILALESHFETVETAADQIYKRPSTDLKKKPKSTSLPLFHRDGPINMPSPQDVLHRDRLRVQSIKTRFKLESKTNKFNSAGFQDTNKAVAYLPVQSCPNNYFVSISLGTPKQELTFSFDTGSDITWTRCIHDPSTISGTNVEFKPKASDSFSIIPDNSDICNELHKGEKHNNTENTCYFDIEYYDGPNTHGYFSKDTLTITQTDDVFPEFYFGCAMQTAASDAAGVLGLGRGSDVSFMTQTEQKYSGVFSYCLPPSRKSTGFLKLGQIDYPRNVKIFTPFIANSRYSPFYFIDIISINVSDVQLPISASDLNNPGTIIDSGTEFTRLPMNVYTKMRDEFKKNMEIFGYELLPNAHDLLDTCYNTSLIEEPVAPNIYVTFKNDVTIDLDSYATLYEINETITCLAFAGNSDIDDRLAIFGINQQKKLEIVYDVDRGRLGFIPDRCE
ncbi:hypothetical protein CASFOL_023003 [Castilleja foliolosa]|uniref:Peptidase A1 domain-containing protein n=1 Tax=Castilleja foliolosa TaxID=1961234 RepID=A0ABD3CLD0_9LAMI